MFLPLPAIFRIDPMALINEVTHSATSTGKTARHLEATKALAAVMLAVASLALTVPAFAMPHQDDPELESLQQQWVVEVYDDLKAYADVPDLEFSLTQFETLSPDQFHVLPWVDIVTMPEGDVIAMHRFSDATRRTATYSTRWKSLETSWYESPAAEEYSEYSIYQVLLGTAEQEGVGDLSEAHSITRYEVLVTLDGQQRSYSAAVIWIANEEGGLEPLVSDNIVAGAEQVADEDLPPTTGPLDVKIATGSCTASTVAHGPIARSADDSNDHFYGQHQAEATFSATCTCDAACYGTCQANVEDTDCDDGGFVMTTCHKMTSDSSATASTKFGGGAACAAGFSCAQTNSFFCLGGKKITVKIKGVEVSFEGAQGANWSATWPYDLTCGPCE